MRFWFLPPLLMLLAGCFQSPVPAGFRGSNAPASDGASSMANSKKDTSPCLILYPGDDERFEIKSLSFRIFKEKEKISGDEKFILNRKVDEAKNLTLNVDSHLELDGVKIDGVDITDYKLNNEKLAMKIPLVSDTRLEVQLQFHGLPERGCQEINP